MMDTKVAVVKQQDKVQEDQNTDFSKIYSLGIKYCIN